MDMGAEFNRVKTEEDKVRKYYYVMVGDMYVTYFESHSCSIGLSKDRENASTSFKLNHDGEIIGLKDIEDEFEDVTVYMVVYTSLTEEQRIK